MTTKAKFTLISIFVLSFLLFRGIMGIVFPHRVTGDTEEIIPLAIGLIYIITIAVYFKQKNWRIGWAMVGISSIIISGATLNLKLMRLLYSINPVIVLLGLVNFYLFYKSDFEPSLAIDKRSFIRVILLLFLTITIFVAFSLISSGHCEN